MAHLFLGNKTKVGYGGMSFAARVTWRSFSCCDTMCCGCYHLFRDCKASWMRVMMKTKQKTSRRWMQPDQIICRSFAVCQRCYEAVTGIVGAKKTGNRVRKLKRAKKAAWQKDGHSGKACCYFWYTVCGIILAELTAFTRALTKI